MLKLAGEFIEGQLADHKALLDAHMGDLYQIIAVGTYWSNHLLTLGIPLLANRLYVAPVVVVRNMTIDRIAIDVTAGDAGKKARLGIYKDNGSGVPGDLLLDAGEVDVSDVETDEITISGDQVMLRGLYWLAVISDGTPSMFGPDKTKPPITVTGISTNFSKRLGEVFVDHTYGTLPDPFGTAVITSGNCASPLIRIKSLD